MIDINKPVNNPNLAWAIQRMRENNSPHTQYQMLQEVMRAHFLCPVEVSPLRPSVKADSITLDEAANFLVPLFQRYGTKELYYFAFTGPVEFGKWRGSENQQTITLTFDNYAALVLNEKSASSGFIVNPYGEELIFNKGDICFMLSEREEKTKCRLMENVVEDGTPIRFGEPTFYPEELIQAISECLKGRKNVNAAYFQVMEAKGEVSFLLVVDFQGDKDELLKNIADASDKYLDGMHLNLMAYDNESGREIARKTKPIYKKKLFGIF